MSYCHKQSWDSLWPLTRFILSILYPVGVLRYEKVSTYLGIDVTQRTERLEQSQFK